MNKTGIILVNLNTLSHTRNVIADLRRQNIGCDLTIIDQASEEPGTQEFLKGLKWNKGKLKVVFNRINEPLNHLWNKFAAEAQNEYLCFLNSDVRIGSTFVKDSEDVFEKEGSVAVTVHSTNHPVYLAQHSHTVVNYIVPTDQHLRAKKIKQGWDFTMRKDDWIPIPEKLRLFYGDDFIFMKMLEKNRNVAYILSSPIVHFQGVSQRPWNGKPFNNKMPPRNDNFRDDTKAWASTGWNHDHNPRPEYTRIKPTRDIVERYGNGIF